MGRMAGFDHLAITTADPEATMSFYRKVLGAEVVYEDKWREDKIPVFNDPDGNLLELLAID